jgi:L-threonylcarbamoyladenylate synthase
MQRPELLMNLPGTKAPLCLPATAANIAAAALRLRQGGVVGFPTETVYGLGAAATDVAAVRRVFAIKGRPAEHPLIVHLASRDWLADWARNIPPSALLLAERFWPGPLTLVLPRQPHVPDAVTGGQASVALRVPAHPVALALLEAAGALVAPSANRFGRISPTTAEHVQEELGDAVDMLLDGGPCEIGVESTVISLLGDQPALLRPGGISVAQLEAVLGRPLVAAPPDVRAPGRLPAHYAPATPLEVLPSAQLAQRATVLAHAGRRVALLVFADSGAGLATMPVAHREIMPDNAISYARILYATLRRLDAQAFDVLLVEATPDDPEWLAISDRLARAAFGTLPV